MLRIADLFVFMHSLFYSFLFFGTSLESDNRFSSGGGFRYRTNRMSVYDFIRQSDSSVGTAFFFQCIPHMLPGAGSDHALAPIGERIPTPGAHIRDQFLRCLV